MKKIEKAKQFATMNTQEYIMFDKINELVETVNSLIKWYQPYEQTQEPERKGQKPKRCAKCGEYLLEPEEPFYCEYCNGGYRCPSHMPKKCEWCGLIPCPTPNQCQACLKHKLEKPAKKERPCGCGVDASKLPTLEVTPKATLKKDELAERLSNVFASDDIGIKDWDCVADEARKWAEEVVEKCTVVNSWNPYEMKEVPTWINKKQLLERLKDGRG